MFVKINIVYIFSDEDLSYLLEAANWAPTHHKTEPWRYVAISGSQNMLGRILSLPKKKEELGEELLKSHFLTITFNKKELNKK